MPAGYDPKLATGAICASGTLGHTLYCTGPFGDICRELFTGSARKGICPDPVPAVDLFAGAFIPD